VTKKKQAKGGKKDGKKGKGKDGKKGKGKKGKDSKGKKGDDEPLLDAAVELFHLSDYTCESAVLINHSPRSGTCTLSCVFSPVYVEDIDKILF